VSSCSFHCDHDDWALGSSRLQVSTPVSEPFHNQLTHTQKVKSTYKKQEIFNHFFLNLTCSLRCPIIAVTRSAQVARQCHLYRGILPIQHEGSVLDDWMEDVNARVNHGTEYAKKRGMIKSGDPIIVLTGWKKGSG